MRQAAFLDRDGVINEVLSDRVKYVNSPKDFYLLEGVGEAIRMLKEAGLFIFVVTNQGGVGLGYMKERNLYQIHKKMIQVLSEQGAFVDEIAYCPHKPYEDCPCRKPKAHMLHMLAIKHHVDLTKSVMVGDREPDIQAGKHAGCKTVLVHSRSKEHFGADAVYPDLRSAVPWILNRKSM